VPLVDWVTGATISEANLDAVARQVVITCTSTTRPASPDEGMTIYETDTDRILIWTGSTWLIVSEPWQTYTPVLTATTTNPTLGTASVASARYQRQHRTVTYQGIIQFGTSGTNQGSGDYRISLPVTAETSITNRRIGSASAYDSSSAEVAIGMVYQVSSTTCAVLYPSSHPKGAISYFGSGAPMAWAASDAIEFTVTYEAA
jgi:hypothetical protein